MFAQETRFRSWYSVLLLKKLSSHHHSYNKETLLPISQSLVLESFAKTRVITIKFFLFFCCAEYLNHRRVPACSAVQNNNSTMSCTLTDDMMRISISKTEMKRYLQNGSQKKKGVFSLRPLNLAQKSRVLHNHEHVQMLKSKTQLKPYLQPGYRGKKKRLSGHHGLRGLRASCSFQRSSEQRMVVCGA